MQGELPTLAPLSRKRSRKARPSSVCCLVPDSLSVGVHGLTCDASHLPSPCSRDEMSDAGLWHLWCPSESAADPSERQWSCDEPSLPPCCGNIRIPDNRSSEKQKQQERILVLGRFSQLVGDLVARLVRFLIEPVGFPVAAPVCTVVLHRLTDHVGPVLFLENLGGHPSAGLAEPSRSFQRSEKLAGEATERASSSNRSLGGDLPCAACHKDVCFWRCPACPVSRPVQRARVGGPQVRARPRTSGRRDRPMQG